MAVTIATAPDTYNGSGMPLQFVVTSDRDDGITLTGVSLSDYSGTVAGTVLATKATHGMYTGDIVEVTGTSMNGTYEITKVDANTFYFTCTYDSGDTSGTVTQLNENFQIKAACKNGAGTVTYATLRQSGVSGNYTFDVGEIYDAYLVSAPQALGGSNSVCDTTAYLVGLVTFTEEFDDADGVLQEGASTNSSPFAVIRAATQYDEDQDLDDYIADYLDTGTFLTTMPRTMYINRGDEIQLSLITTSNTTSAYLYATLTDASGNETSDSTGVADLVGGGSQLAVFPVNSNLYAAGTVKMVLVVKDQTPNTISETMTVYIGNACNNGVRIWWLNPLGGWDAYTFGSKPDKTVNVDRRYYDQVQASKANYLRTLYDVDAWEEFTVTSDYLRPGEGEWLATLLRSHDVRVQNSDGTLQRVVLLNDSAVIDGDEIVKMTISYMVAEGLK